MIPELRVYVCNTLRREAAAALQGEHWGEVSFTALPFCCGRPQAAREAPAGCVPAAIEPNSIVFGCTALRRSVGDRPTGPDSKALLAGQCFELLYPGAAIERWMREGAHLVTPGWLAHWRQQLEQWGFDRETARAFFGESASCILMLDTGAYPEAAGWLREFADHVGLPARTEVVGLDHFRAVLRGRVLEWQLRQERHRADARYREAVRKLADYSMASDLFGRLTGLKSEERVVEVILDLFSMLMAPAGLVYVPQRGGRMGTPLVRGIVEAEVAPLVEQLRILEQSEVWQEETSGLLVRFADESDLMGALAVRGIAFPRYRAHYLSLAQAVGRVSSLALRNARIHDELGKNIVDLEEALAKVKTLSGLLPICCSCKKIRDDQGYWRAVEEYVQKHSEAQFTHSYCPLCAKIYFPDYDEEK